MTQCTAKQQYSGGQQCQREALAGRSKCAAHGSGGVKTSEGRAAIAAAHSKGLGDTRKIREDYRQAISQIFFIAKTMGINWIGRPPKKYVDRRYYESGSSRRSCKSKDDAM